LLIVFFAAATASTEYCADSRVRMPGSVMAKSLAWLLFVFMPSLSSQIFQFKVAQKAKLKWHCCFFQLKYWAIPKWHFMQVFEHLCVIRRFNKMASENLIRIIEYQFYVRQLLHFLIEKSNQQ
jgi:hypothetical protein